ncbi:MAG: hypothetical protein KDI68_09805 [Gammaproteobacteria bacterium]|nr:hypothetical protein [Gammaproteobacteria bacterium]
MYNLPNYRCLLLLGIALLLSGCQSAPVHKVHYRLLESEPAGFASGRALLLPLNIEVKEMSASGITEAVPAWSEAAKANFLQALNARGSRFLGAIELVDMPPLTAEERALLDQHIALNDAVVGSAIGTTGAHAGAAWSHKSERFDYGIGPGLAFLVEKSGADKAIVLTGEDLHSSDGRKAAFVVLAALGVGIPMGHAVTLANVIDLRSGDILWMDLHASATGTSYLDPEHVSEILEDLFKDYPGVEPYREWLSGRTGQP